MKNKYEVRITNLMPREHELAYPTMIVDTDGVEYNPTIYFIPHGQTATIWVKNSVSFEDTLNGAQAGVSVGSGLNENGPTEIIIRSRRELYLADPQQTLIEIDILS